MAMTLRRQPNGPRTTRALSKGSSSRSLNCCRPSSTTNQHIPEDLVDDVTAAWPQARAELNRLHDELQPGTLSNQPDRLAMLQDHGLSGISLRMKLRAWRARFFRFGHRMDRPWLRSALRWADTILESLGDVMPGGGAAQEFKQSVENFLGGRTTNWCP